MIHQALPFDFSGWREALLVIYAPLLPAYKAGKNRCFSFATAAGGK